MALLFYDDFDRDDGPLGDDWDVLITGWAINGGAAEASGLSALKLATYVPAGDEIADFSLEVSKDGAASLTGGIAFRVQDANNWHAVFRDAQGIVRLYRRLSGTLTTIASVSAGSAMETLRVDGVGNRFDVYFNGTLILSATDDSFADGGIGIFAYYRLQIIGAWGSYEFEPAEYELIYCIGDKPPERILPQKVRHIWVSNVGKGILRNKR